MKILKILFRNPQYFIVFFFILILFIIESVILLLTAPFDLFLRGIEWIIKQLLTLIN